MTALRGIETASGAGPGEVLARLAAQVAAEAPAAAPHGPPRRRARAGTGDGARTPDAAATSPRLISTTLPSREVDPIALFAASIEAGQEAALWMRPADRSAMVAIGRAWAIEGEGPDRFRAAESAVRRLTEAARIDAPAGASPVGPILLGGLGFSGRVPAPDDPWSPFGPSSLVLPALLHRRGPDGSRLVASMLVGGPEPADPHGLEWTWSRLLERARELEPGANGIVARPVVAPLSVLASRPDHDAWSRIAGMYAGAVGRGRIDKVVLARRVELRSPAALDVPNALRRLAAAAPESTVFAFRRAGRTFLGATPERLVLTEGRAFRTVALAGTIRRGVNPSEDAALADELLASDKNREEQRIVEAAIRALLAPIVDSIEVAPRPSVLSLRYAQHLLTEISGTLPPEHGLLSVAALLHPTPAVGGEPRAAALGMIDEHEGFERGWYAGPVGWLSADGDGELCVALRCAIVDRTRATLFAGCGIVADSDPEAEWEESRIKLRPVVSALGIPADEP